MTIVRKTEKGPAIKAITDHFRAVLAYINLHQIALLILCFLLIFLALPAAANNDPCSPPAVFMVIKVQNSDGNPVKPALDDNGQPMTQLHEDWRMEITKMAVEYAEVASYGINLITELDANKSATEYDLRIIMRDDHHGGWYLRADLLSRDEGIWFYSYDINKKGDKNDRTYAELLRDLLGGMPLIRGLIRNYELYRPSPPRDPKVEVWLEPEEVEVCGEERVKVNIRVTHCNGKPSGQGSLNMRLVEFDKETDRGYVEFDKARSFVPFPIGVLPPWADYKERQEKIGEFKELAKTFSDDTLRDKDGVAWVHYKLDRKKGLDKGTDILNYKFLVRGQRFHEGKIEVPIESEALINANVVSTNDPVFVGEQVKVYFSDLRTADGEVAPVGEKFLACTDHGQLSGAKVRDKQNCWVQQRVDTSLPYALSVYQAPSSCERAWERISVYDYCDNEEGRKSSGASPDEDNPIAVEQFEISCFPKFSVRLFADWEGVDRNKNFESYSSGEAWINVKGRLTPHTAPGDLWRASRPFGQKILVGEDMIGEFVWNATIHNNREGDLPHFCPKDVVLQEQVGGGTLLNEQLTFKVTAVPVFLGPSGPGHQEYLRWLREKEKSPVTLDLSLLSKRLGVPFIQSSYRQCAPGNNGIYDDEVGKVAFVLNAQEITQPSYLGKNEFSWTGYEMNKGHSISCHISEKADGNEYRCANLSDYYQQRPHNMRFKALWCIGEQCDVEVGSGGSVSGSPEQDADIAHNAEDSALSAKRERKEPLAENPVITTMQKLQRLLPAAPEDWEEGLKFERPQAASWLFNHPERRENFGMDLFDYMSTSTALSIFRREEGKETAVKGRPAKRDGDKIHILVDQYILTLWAEGGDFGEFIPFLLLGSQSYAVSGDKATAKKPTKPDAREVDQAGKGLGNGRQEERGKSENNLEESGRNTREPHSASTGDPVPNDRSVRGSIDRILHILGR